AFHRNTMTNDEGGTDNEEFRTAAIIDRVNTTWEALMGTTFGCVQCHSHPYDPFRHDEYYKFMAFFNDTRDEDTQADYPLLRQFNDSLQRQLSLLTSWMKNGKWTIHLDRPDGPILKIIYPDTTNKAKGWEIAEVDLPPSGGVHDLYFTYTNAGLKKPDDSGMMFDWFYFTQQFPGRNKK